MLPNKFFLWEFVKKTLLKWEKSKNRRNESEVINKKKIDIFYD